MPPIKVIGSISTLPFASDDLQILALFIGLCRLLQLICLAPIWLHMFLMRFREGQYNQPYWCESDLGVTLEATVQFEQDIVLGTDDDDITTGPSSNAHDLRGMTWLSSYLLTSVIYCMVDVSLLAAIWSASSVGTPTQPMGRDEYLRTLLRIKFLFMYLVLAGNVFVGLYLVYVNRIDNYGCFDTVYVPKEGFEATPYYKMFCVILVSQAMEVVLIPVTLISKAFHWFRRHNPIVKLQRYNEHRLRNHQRSNTTSSSSGANNTSDPATGTAEAATAAGNTPTPINANSLASPHAMVFWSRGKSLDTCISGCFRCTRLVCCCRPTDIAHSGDLRDAAEAVLDFFGDSQTIELTWSDLYVSIRMLAQIQRERRLERVKMALSESRKYLSWIHTTDRDDDYDDDDGDEPPPDPLNVTSLMTGNIAPPTDDPSTTISTAGGGAGRPRLTRVPSVAVLRRKNNDDNNEFETSGEQGETMEYERVVRNLLLPENDNDLNLVRRAIRYARHSDAVYGDLVHLCKGYLKVGINLFKTPSAEEAIGSILDTFLEHSIHLDSIGMRKTILAYSNFVNGIKKTPYSICIDQEHSEIILAIRGTASMEDAVIDLQLTPYDLSQLGIRCGFPADGEKCHKGVLTRCIWIYDDLKEHGVLRDLLLGQRPRYPGYNLIITGHSLGAGCAAMLSCMLRRQYPDLQCFAFCPPGGLISARLSDYCKSFVTSFVNGADIIPRMSLANFEKLRDEALETLARIRVSKIEVFRCLRLPHNDRFVSIVNSRLLYSREDTPRDTEFYKELQKFRERRRARKDEANNGSGSGGVDANTRLYLPGRIIHIIRTKKGRRGEKYNFYTPQWADRTDFNEILLSNKFAEDHSVINVIQNLKFIENYLMDPQQAIMDEDDVLGDMFDLTGREKNPILILERSFICCSRPHGTRSVLGALLASVACLLCMMSNSHCVFVSRTTEWIPRGGGNVDDDGESPPSFYGIGVSTGLYNYEQKIYSGSGDRNDPNSYEGTGTCRPYPSWFEVDSNLRVSRILGALAVITGGSAMLILWLSTCVRIPHYSWTFHSFMMILALVFQFIVFGLFFESSLCTEFEYRSEEYDKTYDVISKCEINWGANVAKSCMVIWIVAIILTLRYPKPRF